MEEFLQDELRITMVLRTLEIERNFYLVARFGRTQRLRSVAADSK
jgi:hypothetical protein